MSTFDNFTGKFQATKADYMNLSPKEKWMLIRGIGQFILKINGVPFLDSKFQVRWSAYVPAVALTDILISFFYTVWYYYGHETIKGFLIVSLLGTLTSVSIIEFPLHYFLHSSENKKLNFRFCLGNFGVFVSDDFIKSQKTHETHLFCTRLQYLHRCHW